MKVYNMQNHIEVVMNPQNLEITHQAQYSTKENPDKSLHLTEMPFENQKNGMKMEPKTKYLQPVRVPSNMRSFLKKKRTTLEYLENAQNLTQKSIPKDKNTSQTQNQIYFKNTKAQKLQKNQLDSLKALKALENTAQTLNNDSQTDQQHVCAICEGKIPKFMQKQKVFDCEHEFCPECTKSYIEFKIKNYEQVNCPNQNCQGNLNQKSPFYCSQISLRQRKLYLKIYNFFKIHQSSGTKRLCPKEQCQGTIEIDLNSVLNKCGVCGIEICSKCFASSHPGQCQDYETIFVKENFNLVRCEKCKNFIEKSQGCHHISCKCGYEFCQKCKEPWGKRHICKYSGLSRAVDGWGGCDWGITTQDHANFLFKLPLKFILITLLTLAWTLFSFLAAPLNIMLLLYWMHLLLIKPSIQKIKNEEKCWKIFLFIIFFPIFMWTNASQGFSYFIDHLDHLFPEIPNSYRAIIRI